MAAIGDNVGSGPGTVVPVNGTGARRTARRRLETGAAPVLRDDESERLLLGNLLNHPGVIGEYDAAGVNSELFAHDAHACVWKAATYLIEDGVPLTVVQVRRQLEAFGLLDRVPVPLLARLPDGVPRLEPSGVRALATRLQSLSRARAWRQLADATSRQLADAADRSDIILTGARDALDTLLRADGQTPQLVDDVALLSEPEPPWLLDGWIGAQSLTVLYGETATWKSFAAIDLGLCVATGAAWHGVRVHASGPVVYVASEGRAGLRRRVLAWKVANGLSPEHRAGFYAWRSGFSLVDDTAVRTFRFAVAALKPALVVFDTWARAIAPGDENSSQDAGHAIANLDRLRDDVGCAILVIHHVGATGERERGSTALRGAADTMIRSRRDDTVLTLEIDKQKDAEAPVPLRLALSQVPEAASCVLRHERDATGDLGEPRPLSAQSQRALDILWSTFQSSGATRREWAEVAAASGIPKTTFYRAADQLQAQGRIAIVRGRYRVAATPDQAPGEARE